MQLEKCQKRLALLWYSWSAFLFIYLLIQTTGGFFGKTDPPMAEIFGWFFANMLPFLSLITSIWPLLVISSRKKHIIADDFWYKITFFISIFYLAILTVVLIIPAFSLFNQIPLRFMQSSNSFLGPLQGMATAALGAFFFKSK
jgi:hypothetical protein